MSEFNLAATTVDLHASQLSIPESENVTEYVPQTPREIEEARLDAIHNQLVDAITCNACGFGNREDVLMLCDGCNAAAHCDCMGLERVPDGDWWCPTCEIHSLCGLDKVVVYLRVSSQQQRNEDHHGLDTQNAAILNFCMQQNLHVSRTLYDVGSGRHMPIHNGYNTLMNVPRNTLILVYSVSRFGRNHANMQAALATLHAKGCMVYSVSEGINSHHPRFLTLAQEAENESLRLGAMISASYARRRAEGHYLGGAPFGFEIYRDLNNVRRIRPRQDEYLILEEIANCQNAGDFDQVASRNWITSTLSTYYGQPWTIPLMRNVYRKARAMIACEHPILQRINNNDN